MAPAGVDSSDLWQLNVTEPYPTWQNVSHLCSGDQPRPLSGSRLQFDPIGNQLVLMGGYSCTSGFASGLGGGTSCFSNSVWLMSLNESSLYRWTQLADPNPGSVSTWPSPRAWHSTVLLGRQLWVFGGQYQDASATVYFLNDVQVFDLSLLAWQSMNVKGATPPVMWSQTSNLVLSPDDGIWHMVNIGGCSQSLYYPDVYILKLNTAVTADNCQLTGAGMLSTTAGATASFLIQTRVALNVSNSSTLSSTGEQAGHNVVFGDILTYGVQLNFDVLVIGQVGGISTRVESSIDELGNGLYNVTYVAFGGVSSSCGNTSEPAKVTVSITLDGQYLPSTPFNVPVLPATLVAAQTSVTGETDAVQGKSTAFVIQPADAYGNVAQGRLNASLLAVEVNGEPLSATAVSTLDEGVFQVEYVAPSQAQYSLSILLDGQAVSGSPFAISPLANMDISQSEETGMRVLAGLASLCLLLAMVFLYYARAVPKVKAASPLFLFLILVGCQLALVAVLLPVAQQPSTSSSTCAAYAYTLSVGFTLAVSSLVVKTWRIARIFDRRKIKVRVITDRSLLVPVAALVAADIVFNAIWLGVDPLLPTDFTSSSNELLHYTACSSSDTLLWYALTFVPKGVLLAYGVVLASQVRNVPSAFNESKWIGVAVYNIAFCSVILLAILLLLTSSPASVYVIRSIGVIWCVLVTGGLLLLPKLHAHAVVDPGVPSSSDHKGLTSELPTSTNTLKGYESSHSAGGRSAKSGGQLQMPSGGGGASDSSSGLPPRSAWQKSARATSTPTSSKAPHRTIVNSAEFKWEPATATASKPLTREEATLPSLSMAVVPLHSPRSRRTAQYDSSEVKSRAVPSPTAGADAERLIAQLQQQLSVLSAVVDAITLNTPIHTEHGLALASTVMYASFQTRNPECGQLPLTADKSSSTAEQHVPPVPQLPPSSSLAESALPPLPLALLLPTADAESASSSGAALSSPSRHLSVLHENKTRNADKQLILPMACTDDWLVYEAAVLSRLEEQASTSEGEEAPHESGQRAAARPGSSRRAQPNGTAASKASAASFHTEQLSEARLPLSVLLAHPVCVALLKAELAATGSVHLLLFVLHCQRYRLLHSAKLRRAVASRVQACFLSQQAQPRVELSEACLSAIVAAVQQPDEQACTAELFDAAQSEVADCIERQWMARLREQPHGTVRHCQAAMRRLQWHWPAAQLSPLEQ